MAVQDTVFEEKKNKAKRIGNVVLILLVTLTIGEFFLGLVAPLWWAPLLAIALLKAFFVVRDYMHIGRLFAGDEEA
jgi:hypothetical protein